MLKHCGKIIRNYEVLWSIIWSNCRETKRKILGEITRYPWRISGRIWKSFEEIGKFWEILVVWDSNVFENVEKLEYMFQENCGVASQKFWKGLYIFIITSQKFLKYFVGNLAHFYTGFTFESATCLRQMLQCPRQTVHLH